MKIGEEVIQNPKADPVNFITKSAQLLKNNASNLVPVLEPSPNLSEQIKALNDAGINGYIVYSENGNYTKIK